MAAMKILSLFDGMSCGMIAFRQLGIPVDEYHTFAKKYRQLKELQPVIQMIDEMTSCM